MKKFICIHGHFYQPPRENAWLEVIERQPSAHPFHDWNERIQNECYGPNAASRILNTEDRITNIVNNYSRISFNIGPTLFSWMQTHDPKTYKRILAADRESAVANKGHGNALAQVYNHVIMPLASEADKETQVIWGIADFMFRFERKPEGMWLAETAVDTATLEVLAKHGILFTVLAPRQAQAVKSDADGAWIPVDESSVDTTQPYKVLLPSGNSIAVFFYDGKISREVAFSGLLNSGKLFADALVSAHPGGEKPALVHIATDGESYGHHHYRGDMALASCLDHLFADPGVNVVNYGAFLEMFPPNQEVKIRENSSWSCVHGVERWRSNCGCTDGGNPGFHQRWREPLRNALELLKNHADVIFEREVSAFTHQPWHLRNQYIAVVLDRTEENIDRFFSACCHTPPTGADRIRLVRLLEMQRHALLMFTSCGWFFDEVSRIETRQILQYADRVIQIAEHETGNGIYAAFLDALQAAPSNIARYENAAQLYRMEIRPQRMTLTRVGLHHAVLSVFESSVQTGFRLNYHIEAPFFEKLIAGEMVLAAGMLDLQSTFTYASEQMSFATLYLGGHHVIGGYSDAMDQETFEELFLQLRDAFRTSNISEITLLIHRAFGDKTCSFFDIFPDDRDQLIARLLKRDIENAETGYRAVYDRTYTLVNMLRRQGTPVPDLLLENIHVVMNAEVKRWLSDGNEDIFSLDQLVEAVHQWKVKLDIPSLGEAVSARVLKHVDALSKMPYDMVVLDLLSKILIRMHDLQIKFRLWKIQNKYFSIGKEHLNNKVFMRNLGEEEYHKWQLKFKAVGEQLKIRF